MIWSILSFIIIFFLVVVSHEFGHFLVGRLNGIGVDEFTVGLGPVIFRKKGKHCLFTIRLFPIGGACIFKGMGASEKEFELDENGLPVDTKEEPEAADDNDSTDEADDTKEAGEYRAIPFNEAPVFARIATVFAGPFFNVILAFIFSLVLCWYCGSDAPVLAGVMEGYPAESAGIQEGDIITRINSQRIYVWREISVVSLLNYGKTIEVEYERDGERHVTSITPKYDEETDRYYIGFQGGASPVECNNISVFKYALIEVRYWLITTYRSLLFMFSGHASMDDVAGPVGMANIIDETIEETSQYGLFIVILNLINIVVLLSVNLGVLNLLPFPALDGGRLLLLFVEVIIGRKISEEKEGLFHMIGFMILMVFMVVVLFNDIMRVFGG